MLLPPLKFEFIGNDEAYEFNANPQYCPEYAKRQSHHKWLYSISKGVEEYCVHQ